MGSQASVGVAAPISGVILAGGQSTRLGVDKVLLDFGGTPLVTTVIGKLRRLTDDLIVVGRYRELFDQLDALHVEDDYPGCGALGGIYTGLRASRYDKAIIVACDMPFLSLRLIRHMVRLSEGFDVVIPRGPKGVEPLHAVYSRTCLEPIQELLSTGVLRIIRFFPRVRVRYMDSDEIAIYDPQYRSFLNINTREDLDLARGTASGLHEDARSDQTPESTPEDGSSAVC